MPNRPITRGCRARRWATGCRAWHSHPWHRRSTIGGSATAREAFRNRSCAALHSIERADRRIMPDSHVSVAVTGAAGQIGYALVYRIASGQMFGPTTSVDLQLLELEAALPALDGVRMELEDCAFPLLERIVCTSSADEAFRGANWALLVGAVPRREGMERKDLLAVNGGIFTGQGASIARNSADDCRVLVVGNPCNTNALIGSTAAAREGMPSDRWFAMTMLDQSRGRSQLAHRAGVPVRDVKDLA